VRKNKSIATMWYEKAAKEDPKETAEFLEILRRPPKVKSRRNGFKESGKSETIPSIVKNTRTLKIPD